MNLLILCSLLLSMLPAVDRTESARDCFVDLERDGHVERIVGHPRGASRGVQTGTVTVLGSDGSVRFTLAGDSRGDRFGWSVAIAGDVDADGVKDILVGAPLDDTAGNGSGSVFVFSGRDGTRLHSFHGTAARWQFGYSVASAGDVDGDGHADILVGAPFADCGARNTGLTQLFSGKDGSVLRTTRGTTENQRLGKRLPTRHARPTPQS